MQILKTKRRLVLLAALLVARCTGLAPPQCCEKQQPSSLLRRKMLPLVASSLLSMTESASARSTAEIQLKSKAGDGDLKGMLGSFTTQLEDEAKAKEQQKIDDAKPINEKIVSSIQKSADEQKKKNPRQMAVQKPRPKKSAAPKRIGDGTL